MRLRFFSPVDEHETAEHLATLRRIDAFWLGARHALGRGGDRDGSRVARALRAIDRCLRLELGRAPTGERDVFVLPERPSLEPLAQAVVERAPAIPGCRVLARRPALPLARALGSVREKAGFDLGTARVRVGIGRGHLLEIVVCSPEFSSGRDARAFDAAELAARLLVGDEVFDDWMGAVEVAPMPRPSPLRLLPTGADPQMLALEDLAPAVRAAVQGIRAGLPDDPYHLFCEHAEWTLLDLEPDPAAEYAAQDDLSHATTMLPEMLKCFLERAPFSSCRFSKHGEVFCYAKVEALDQDVEARLARRLELEDALSFSLVPGRLGCVVGAGLGIRYSYVDLALDDLDAGVKQVRATLQRQGVGKRSWLLFCDSGWGEEWIGVWDDSPPPPAV